MKRILLVLIFIATLVCSVQSQERKGDAKTTSTQKPVGIEQQDANRLVQLFRAHINTRNAAEVAKQVLSDEKNSCFRQAIFTFEQVAQAREAEYSSFELSLRYTLNVPKDFVLNSAFTAFEPPKEKSAESARQGEATSQGDSKVTPKPVQKPRSQQN